MVARINLVLIAALLLEHSGLLPCVCLAESHGASLPCCAETSGLPEASADCCGGEAPAPRRPICGCDHSSKALGLQDVVTVVWDEAAVGTVPPAHVTPSGRSLVDLHALDFAPPPPLARQAILRVRLI